MTEFQSPISLSLILLVLAAVVWFFVQRQKKSASLQFSSTSLIKETPKGIKSYFIWLPLVLKATGLILAIVALARPQQANTKITRNVEGIDIVIALDVSDSMLIEDMKPLNRLEAAKETIAAFVQKRTSDRIGLVIFAGEAFTLVPPTLDYQLLLNRTAEITTAASANIKDGTALGVALASAAGRLKDSQAKSRVVIFMTDGENNSGTIDPETGLEIAKGYGIKVYSIGVGRDGPTRIPVFTRDVFGNKVKTYQPFESTVNEDLLQRMASDTGGKFYRAIREDSLSGVFNEIDRLEKTKVDVNKFTRYEELFQRWLLWAIVFYCLGTLLEATVLRRVP
ncbi:MAG: vWA domain-containing protein [Bdellovibrionia bacterium]